MKRPLITSVSEASSKLKILLHGPSGAGKTRLAATFPRPLIFDLEGGTLSVRGMTGVDVVPPQAFRGGHPGAERFLPGLLLEYVDWLASSEASDYQTVVLDSLTELQEQFMAVTLPAKSDPRQAYGEWSAYVRTLMSKLRALDKHFVVIARTQMKESFEGEGSMLYPQISPASWTNVPALVDYGFFIQQKTRGLGQNATVVPVLYSRSATAYTKTRTPFPTELVEPTFPKIAELIAAGLKSESAA